MATPTSLRTAEENNRPLSTPRFSRAQTLQGCGTQKCVPDNRNACDCARTYQSMSALSHTRNLGTMMAFKPSPCMVAHVRKTKHKQVEDKRNTLEPLSLEARCLRLPWRHNALTRHPSTLFSHAHASKATREASTCITIVLRAVLHSETTSRARSSQYYNG